MARRGREAPQRSPEGGEVEVARGGHPRQLEADRGPGQGVPRHREVALRECRDLCAGVNRVMASSASLLIAPPTVLPIPSLTAPDMPGGRNSESARVAETTCALACFSRSCTRIKDEPSRSMRSLLQRLDKEPPGAKVLDELFGKMLPVLSNNRLETAQTKCSPTLPAGGAE